MLLLKSSKSQEELSINVITVPSPFREKASSRFSENVKAVSPIFQVVRVRKSDFKESYDNYIIRTTAWSSHSFIVDINRKILDWNISDFYQVNTLEDKLLLTPTPLNIDNIKESNWLNPP